MKVGPEMMDPQLRRRGQMGRLLSGRSEAALRRGHRLLRLIRPAMSLRKPGDLRVRQEFVERGDGTRLRLLVYGPREHRSGVAGLLWLHSGGYAFGCPEQDVATYRRLIARSGAIVVAPDYRLSPEAPYPAALEDCYLALKWLRDNATQLGVRTDQLAVGGESGGGGLTAALTLYARDRGEVSIAFQMPIYPMIDDRAITESARDNDAPVWDSVTNASAWRLYLGSRHGTGDVPAYAAPARATEFAGLPPAFTYVGDLEPFRDETIAYVENLRSAGVPVEFEIYPGCWHGFDQVAPKAEVSVRARRARDAWFARAVREYFAAQPG
ncbi:alpha/beta hydrolase [Nocardia sp. BMG51109]|uniref:alpha/beta hydrolase n=1 Tax=Nocardia sp. BMG51109 TaxID=1056816 RepID=UPI0004653946|nr:alpha/beta hydrolase [Nocardia sp. BMG51109]